MTAIYAVVIFFVGLDRFFKVLAFSGQGREFNLIGEILKFKFKANYNIAFSLPIAGAWLKAIIWLIILLLIFCLARAWRDGKRATAISLLAIIIGAASNLFDRLKYGYVIDYLDLKYFTVFNSADAMIVVGVFLLIVLLNKKKLID